MFQNITKYLPTFFIFSFLAFSCESHLCGTKDISCAPHLWENNSHIPYEACTVKYYPLNSHKCHSLEFAKNPHFRTKLGEIQLFGYVTEHFRQTLIGVHLRNISWQRAKMKFARIDTEHENNMCRSFEIWDNVTISNTSFLTYDCSWSSSDYEGHNYTFEYELGEPWAYNKLIFKVPIYEHFARSTNVTSLEVFSYMDVTDSEWIILHIQAAKSVYNISTYIVEEMFEWKNLTIRLSEISLNTDQLVYQFSTSKKVGYYYFLVRPVSEQCPNNVCKKTTTPKIFIPRQINHTLLIVCTGIIVVMCALCLTWSCRRYKKGRKYNQILLVYNSDSKSHFKVVYRLALVLKEVLNLRVFLDVIDIPMTPHKDPLVWCSDAFERATDIIYITSPTAGNFKKNLKNIYKIDGVFQKYIRSELVKTDSKKQIMVLTFSYLNDTVPIELKRLRTFNLMKDMNRFLSALGLSSYQYSSFANILKRSKLQNDEKYKKLITSVQKAANEFGSLSEEVTETKELLLFDTKIIDEFVLEGEEDKSVKLDSRLFKNKNDFSTRLSDLDLSGDPSEEKNKSVQLDVEKMFDINNLQL